MTYELIAEGVALCVRLQHAYRDEHDKARRERLHKLSNRAQWRLHRRNKRYEAG